MTVNDKELKNVYIIDNNGVKRRIKRIYIGVNGKAKKIADTISGPYILSEAHTNLSQAREYLAATSIGDYALFGGGYSSGLRNVVDAYDTSLVRTTPANLSQARKDLAATSIGNYTLFGGGNVSYSSYYYYSSAVDSYDTSLVRATPTPLSSSRSSLAATSIGDYALFGGGYYSSSDTASFYYSSSVVDAYDTSLVRTTPTPLSKARCFLAATSIGDYALFGGGVYYHYSSGSSDSSSVVDAYDTSLVRTTPTPLSSSRNFLAATSIGNYALFGGGSDVVDAYDTSLVRTTPTPLSSSRSSLAATSIGNYALFGGGYKSAVVDAYDTSLVRTTPTPLSKAKTYLAATSIGNYALFGGGHNASSSYSDVVDAYSVKNILI